MIRRETPLLLALLAVPVAFFLEHLALQAGRAAALALTAALIATIVVAALRVAHHAEVLAEKVGEPYGTMILTLSAVLVEVVILAIMLTHTQSDTLVRDTIYSAIMLDVNGILGLAAVLGGLKHGEQPYNVDSGNSYLIMILSALGVSMFVPAFLPAALLPAYGYFIIGIMLFQYAMFLRLQTKQHSYFFSYSYAETGTDDADHSGSTRMSAGFLILGIVCIGLLAEVMSKTLGAGLEGTNVPPVVAAIVVALISASPEIVTALRAALANRMQPVVNIALGASLSTLILTVPLMLVLAMIQHHSIVMALTPTQMVMCGLTLAISAINLQDGETNAIEGTTHFVLFAAFLMLSALGL